MMANCNFFLFMIHSQGSLRLMQALEKSVCNDEKAARIDPLILSATMKFGFIGTALKTR
jgi:hypothetical protein